MTTSWQSGTMNRFVIGRTLKISSENEQKSFQHNSGTFTSWVKWTHKTPHLTTLVPKTHKNTRWQDSLTHRSAGMPSRALGQSTAPVKRITWALVWKTESCLRATTHPIPQKVIKLISQPKFTLRVSQRSRHLQRQCYNSHMAALSLGRWKVWVLTIQPQAIFTNPQPVLICTFCLLSTLNKEKALPK